MDHLLIFTGNGKVKDFIGGYSEYREYIKALEAEEKSQLRAAEAASKPVQKQEKVTKKKLTWKEQKELEALEADLDKLGAEKKSLEALLSNPGSDMEQTLKASERIGGLLTEIDEKELRLLELYEKQS